jgi:hypothetical protein
MVVGPLTNLLLGLLRTQSEQCPRSDESQPAFAKSSVCDRIAFADGVFETGLPMDPSEKTAMKLASGLECDPLSSPV